MNSKENTNLDGEVTEIYEFIKQIERYVNIYLCTSLGLLACTIVLTIIVLLE